MSRDSDSDTEAESELLSNTGVTLELGDIIEISAPQNAEIHQETFFIIYLDETKIKMSNVSTFQPYVLRLSESGVITDESIEIIDLLSRSEERGYARQHLLLPKTWIDIHFGGDVPATITGEITNLEEDMIEITMYPSMDTIYIDFEYKGLPENIPIDSIVIRTKPAELDKLQSLLDIKDNVDTDSADPFGIDTETANDEAVESTIEATIEYRETGESVIRLPSQVIPEPHIRDVLHSMYLDADSIIFGEDLEDIAHVVEVPESQRRYGIETQVNDMMDELLSAIPNSQRTKAVLDNIHNLIERFTELRNQFSKFDANGNVYDMKLLGPTHKPLVNRLVELDTKLKWILPVIAQKRKLYDSGVEMDTDMDVTPITIKQDLTQLESIQKDYIENLSQGNNSKYTREYQRLHPYFTPFESPLEPEKYLMSNKPVLTNLESIIGTLDNFSSTVGYLEGMARRRFVIQRHNLGMTRLAKTSGQQKVFIREPISPNDSMTVKSIVMLPDSAVYFSNIDLPTSSIMTKASLGQTNLYLFRLLRKNTEIYQHVIDNIVDEMDYSKWEADTKKTFMSTIQEFVLDDTLQNTDNRMQKLLNVVVPNMKTLLRVVRKYIRDKLSIVEVTRTLEPFMIYPHDLTYKQYMEIRYFIIKDRIPEYKQNLAKRMREFQIIRTAKYNVPENLHRLERILFEKREFMDMVLDIYKLGPSHAIHKEPAEWMTHIWQMDQGRAFSTIVRYMMMPLITPENLVAALTKPANGQDDDEMSKSEKILAQDCARRILTKRYERIADLQKDNESTEIYYDKEFDDTPYELLKHYADDQKRLLPAAFVDFLAENLVVKHDCPERMAKELAITLIAGKKMVRDGEYAIVELRPKLMGDVDTSNMTQKELQAIKLESATKQKILYYRRIKNHWIHDKEIDENVFVDTNTLFCDLGKICFKNTKNRVCETNQTAEARMREIARKKTLGEFDRRFDTSVEGLKEVLDTELKNSAKHLRKMQMLHDIQSRRANDVAFQMGKYVVIDAPIQSPYMPLANMIISQSDFVKKQKDIERFVNKFCREPMVSELSEDAYWLYCKETNTKLIPTFLVELAKAYTNGRNYLQKLDELCHTQGVDSDDGDAVVDKHSGYVIRKLDLSNEEGFDQAGRHIVSHEIMEKDAGTVLMEMMGKRKDRVFVSETAETVFRVYAALATNIGIPLDSVEDFVVRVSLELIEKNVMSDVAYEKRAAKMEKEKGKRPVPYSIYRNQTILAIVSAILLVSIQTAIPSFKMRKTFPGCILSFDGFPMSENNTTGLQYIACILNKTKSSISPWDSIQKLTPPVLQTRIREILEKFVITRSDLTDLYTQKREYIIANPHEIDIPPELRLSKWLHFLPPVVDFSVTSSLRGLSKEFKDELFQQMRDGTSTQRNLIYTAVSKVTQYGYGLVESINHIVGKKDLLLKTASKVLFMENACCNEVITKRPLDYFALEDRNIELYAQITQKWSSVLANIRNRTRPAMLYHAPFTRIVMPPVPMEHFEENVYCAFIYYCNFDNDRPIPQDLLHICPEKIPEYDASAPLPEKMEFLKRNGKRFTLASLNQLMMVINTRNIVEKSDMPIGSPVLALQDFLEYLENKDSTVVEAPLRKHLSAVLGQYDSNKFVAEDSVEMTRLKNYLAKANNEMAGFIYEFFKKHANAISNLELNKVQDFIDDLTIFNGSSDYTATQFIKNSVYSMTKVYPEIVRTGHSLPQTPPKHWGLSKNHMLDVGRFMQKYYEPIQKFKNDRVLMRLLTEIQLNIVDLNTLIHELPIPEPIKSGDISYYAPYDRRTVHMLMTYVWNSVLYEYIRATDNIDLLQADLTASKTVRSDRIRESRDDMDSVQSSSIFMDDEAADMDATMSEMQLEMGDIKQLKSRVADMLLAFLHIDRDNKNAINMSYDDIQLRTQQSRQEEKKLITDFLRDMDSEERKTEDMKKLYKMGRWNIGMQKGLVNYDPATYDRERDELLARLGGIAADVGEDTDAPIERDVDDLERDAENEANEESDLAAFDFSGLDEDYTDGNYYEEDISDDF